jgi:hypothetical protein
MMALLESRKEAEEGFQDFALKVLMSSAQIEEEFNPNQVNFFIIGLLK